METEGISSEFGQLKSSQVLLLVSEESALLRQGWEVASGKSDNCHDLHILKPHLLKKAEAFYVESLLFYGAHVGLGKTEVVNL